MRKQMLEWLKAIAFFLALYAFTVVTLQEFEPETVASPARNRIAATVAGERSR
jgi:hypothetical protein